MSHYSVLVCVPGDETDIDTAVSEALAPYDENLPVAPYRVYEEGMAEEHWLISRIRTGAQHHRDGTGLPQPPAEALVPADVKALHAAQEEVRAAYAAYAEQEAQLDQPVTWPTVARLYNEAEGYPVPTADQDDAEDTQAGPMRVDADGHAFIWSDRNPDAKWDFWRIGGRWTGHFPAVTHSDELIVPGSHWDGPVQSRFPYRLVCDGGPKRLLDLELMRETAGIAADERYSRYDKVVGEYGTALPWSHFCDLVQRQELDWDGARRRYREQPLIAGHDQLPPQERLTDWGRCIVDEFRLPRIEYVMTARAAAVPGYATVTIDGEWAAPGRIGWWGMSTDTPQDRTTYLDAINAYLDGLPDDTLLVIVDCHI